MKRVEIRIPGLAQKELERWALPGEKSLERAAARAIQSSAGSLSFGLAEEALEERHEGVLGGWACFLKVHPAILSALEALRASEGRDDMDSGHFLLNVARRPVREPWDWKATGGRPPKWFFQLSSKEAE